MTSILKTKGNFYGNLIGFVNDHWFYWLSVGYVLAVPLVAAGLGFIAAKKNPKYALVAAILPLIVVGVEVALRNYQYSQLVILCTALFIPFSLPTGSGSRLVFSLVITIGFVALWILRMVVVEKRFRLYPTPMNSPLLGFMIVTVISLGWSTLFRDPLVTAVMKTWRNFPLVQTAATVMTIMLPMAFLLTVNFVHKIQTLKIMVAAMLLGGFLGLFRQYGHILLPVNVNGLFSLWIISLSTGLAIFNKQLPRWQRGLLLLLALLWIHWNLGLHISWMAGWLPGVIAVGILTFMRSKKWALILMLGVVIYVGSSTGYFYRTFLAERQESGVTRLAAWEISWRIDSQHLLLGTGTAGYAVYYMTYFPTEAMATHNNYIDILAQYGIIGFAFCIWFFISLAWHGYRLILRLRGRGDFLEGLANAAFAGTIGCIVIMAFGDWMFPFAYTQTIAGFNYAVYNWIFMATLLVIDRLTKEQVDIHA